MQWFEAADLIVKGKRKRETAEMFEFGDAIIANM
jgi:hypothetical protein